MRQVFGVPMTAGQTPREAAEGFVGEFAPIFGGEGIDLREQWVRDPGRGKTFFAYQQFIDDLPVYGSIARVMVLNEPSPRVAYAAAKVAPHPAEPLPRAVLTGQEAVEAARRDPRAVGLSVWGDPWEAVWCDPREWGHNRLVGRAWFCRGRSRPTPADLEFVVDAVTGEVHAVLDHIFRFAPARTDETISGTVSGTVISGLSPYWGDGNHSQCEPTLVEAALPQVLVQVFVDEEPYSSAFTDGFGAYSLNAPSNEEVTVRATLIGPRWRVRHCVGQEWNCPDGPVPFAEVSGVTGPQEELDIEFPLATGEPNREYDLAKTVAQYEIARLDYDFVGLGVMPTNPPIFLNVNVNGDHGTCIPRFGQELIDLQVRPSSSACPNGAYSTIIAHEYGHIIHVYILGLYQSVSGEGYGDSVAVLFHDTPLLGEHWHGCGANTYERNLADPGYSYPYCDAGGYQLGAVLAGCWRDVRENLTGASALGDAQGLFADWSLIYTGDDAPPPTCAGYPTVQWPQAAGPGTLIEVLTVDDDDANFENGTPHDDKICSAFCENAIPVNDSVAVPCAGSECPESAGEPACQADCDTSTGVRVLDVFDFLCFMNRFEARDPFACNTDITTGWDVCDAFDLLRFQGLFAEGCQ